MKSKKASLFLFRLVRKLGFTQALLFPWQVPSSGGSPDTAMCMLGAGEPQRCTHERSRGKLSTVPFLLWVHFLCISYTESRSRHNRHLFRMEICLQTGTRVLCSPDFHVKGTSIGFICHRTSDEMVSVCLPQQKSARGSYPLQIRQDLGIHSTVTMTDHHCSQTWLVKYKGLC